MLRGTTTGASRKDVLQDATNQAEAYFGTTCLKIHLINETADQERYETMIAEPASVRITYRASYTATVEHAWRTPLTGFPKCTKCGKVRRQ